MRLKQGTKYSRLKLLRARSGMTLLELEAKSGVTETTISFLENGKRTARVKTLAKLAGALGVDVEELMYLAGDSTDNQPKKLLGRPVKAGQKELAQAS